MGINLGLTIKNLNQNGIATFYAEKKSDVIPVIEKMIRAGDKIAVGGSMTLFDCGIIDFLRKGNYKFYDRYIPDLSADDIRDIYIKSYDADIYLTSCNAVTESGELYNVDGRSNRVSAIAHGPKSVIMIVSTNKIVKDLSEAIFRVKTIAAPKNCVRLNCETYCKDHGECVSLLMKNPIMTDGCRDEDRICCNYLVSAKQRVKDRIKIIFVNEEAGY